MKNKIKQIMIVLGMALSSHAFADSATTTVNLGGTVLPGCVFTQPSYTVNFGQVAYGTVPKANTTVGFVCSNNLSWSLTTLQDPSTVMVMGTSESLRLRVFLDSGYQVPIDNLASANGIGTGITDYRTMYFKITNNADAAPDLGEGKVIMQSATLSANINFILTY